MKKKHDSRKCREIKVILRRKLQIHQRRFAKHWYTQSGDWTWLQDKPMPIAAINRHLWRLSVPSMSFYLLLGLSGIISTLGLLADSVAIIIGAMIIAPLMGPIIGMAYAMTMGNRRLLRRSSLTLSIGVILTIFLSWLTCVTIGLKSGNPEIFSRANPSLIDLGVALSAGAAGAFANSRRRIADALPGVAIAVALVPPLSVVGIGLAWGENRIFIGSLLLFITNLISIIFSGGLVFLTQRYGKLEKAQQGLFVSVFTLAVLGIPLGFQMKTLLLRENVRQQVKQLISQETITFSQREIRSIEVRPQDDYLHIELEITTESGNISAYQVDLVRDFLAKELHQPVILEVHVFPITVIKSQSSQ